MKNLMLFIPLFFLLSCGSNDQSKNSFEIENAIWNVQLDDIGEYSLIYDPIVYENIIIYPTMKTLFQDGELIAYDKNTGEELWQWSEALQKYDKNGFSKFSYAYDGVLAIGDNNYTAGLNIYTGETIWENLDEFHSLSAIRGIDEVIFKTRNIPDEKYFIEKANIHTGEWETIYTLKKEEGFNLGSKLPFPIKYNDKIYLSFIKGNWHSVPYYVEHTFLYLYNVTDDLLEWKSDTIQTEYNTSGTPGVFPAFDEGKILLSNDAIYAYNIEDGSLAWRNYYGGSFTLTSRIEAKDGKVFGNNGQSFFIGLDVHTGDELFRTETGGSPSRVQYHNGKCYLASISKPGQGNWWMEIDGTSGYVLNEFRAPSETNDPGIFNWALTVDPETGNLYTGNQYHAICYNFE